MIYRTFGRTGWQTSAVGLGTWNLGNQWGSLDDATAWKIVRTAFDGGVNLFDTAESYGIPNGCSEDRLGVALAGIRHQCYLVSKIGHWGQRTGQGVPKNTPDMIRLCAHACLGRLRTDWVDAMLCHEGNCQDPGVYIEAFEMLKTEGRVRVYCISTDSLDVVRKFHEVSGGNCSVVELNYSLLNRAPEAELLPYCQARNIAVLVRGPVAMGMLSGRYDADTRFTDTIRAKWHDTPESQAAFEAKAAAVERLKAAVAPGEEMVAAALRYTFTHPACPVTIPGATRPRQAATNAAAGAEELPDDLRAKLLAALE